MKYEIGISMLGPGSISSNAGWTTVPMNTVVMEADGFTCTSEGELKVWVGGTSEAGFKTENAIAAFARNYWQYIIPAKEKK